MVPSSPSTRRAVLVGGLAVVATPALAGLVIPTSTIDSELRGLSPTGGKTWWASGSKGWIIRGRGERQEAIRIVGAEGLDFRGLHAFDDHNVLAMSAGPGGSSQLWRTRDGGKIWTRSVTNEDPEGFWDSIAFVDDKRGYILGDPTGGRFTVLYTDDAGERWRRLKPEAVPLAAPNEGAFAASNGCVALGRQGQVAFCTGGAGKARVYLSRGVARGAEPVFVAMDTPILADAPSKGAFGVAFAKDGALWVCGGDYRNPKAAGVNLARLAPGALAFEPVAAPAGYLSGISVKGATVMATGLAGTIVSSDGAAFARVSDAPMNTARLTSKKTAVLCGPKGAVGVWRG